MRRLSTLDRMVHNFQHNWETNPQFRALWSGGLGLGIVVMMCACLGFAFTFAGAAAASFSGSSNGPSTNYAQPSGTVRPGSADSNITFPTQTVPQWAAPQIPAGAPIPPSLTPAPTPTALPTATPVPTSPVGPGGGGGGGGGGGSSGTVSLVSAVLKGGASGSVTLQTSVPNAQVNIFINWPGGASSPTNTGSTNGAGLGTISTTTVPSGCTGQVKLWVKTDISGTNTFYAPCTP